MFVRIGAAALIGLLAVAPLGGCGGRGSHAFAVIHVTAITSPFSSGVSSPFTVDGSGFGSLSGSLAIVRFTAEAGTPFLGGTSSTADVVGTIQSNVEVTGMSPTAAGGANFNAFVSVILPSGAAGKSATPIAVFVGLPPSATDDNYATTGNVRLVVDVVSGVLANDTPPGIFVSLFDATSANGGDVAVAADGSFTFDPAPGFEGSDTFTYTASNGMDTSVGTVTVVVTEMVWFIDTQAAVPGDGRFSAPFDTLAAFSAVQGGGGGEDPEAGDVIFLYADPGGAPGSVTLLPMQSLIGNGVDLVVNATLLVPAAGRPTLQGTGAAAVALATDNVVRGLNLSHTAGGGILGTGFGTLQLDQVAVNVTGGPAISLDGGDPTAIFDSVTSTGSATQGVFLQALTGSVSIDQATVTNSGTHGVRVTDSIGTFTFGGLSVSTVTGRGVHVSNVGSLTVLGATNTLATLSGVALEVTDTTIPVAGLTFRSISSSGAPSGIVLGNTTSGPGILTVTGDGTGVKNASGGLIGASTSTAIFLHTTNAVSFTQLDVVGADGFGIDAQFVNGFTYQDAVVNTTGDEDEEHSFGFQNLYGESLIEDVSVDGINESAVAVLNNSADDGNPDVLVIRRLEVLNHTATGFAEHGVDVQGEGTSNLVVTVEDCDFLLNANAGLGVLATSTGTAQLTVVVDNCDFDASLSFGSGGIQMAATGSSTATFHVFANVILDSPFIPLIVNNDDDATSFVRVEGNTLDGDDATNNGFGIQARQDGNGEHTVLIHDNEITGIMFDGIRAQARDSTDGTGILNLTISANTIAAPTNFGAGAWLKCEDTNSIQTSIFGNTLAGTNTSPPADTDIHLEEDAGTFGVTQLAPTVAVDVNEIDDANGGATVGVVGGVAFNAGATPTPP